MNSFKIIQGITRGITRTAAGQTRQHVAASFSSSLSDNAFDWGFSPEGKALKEATKDIIVNEIEKLNALELDIKDITALFEWVLNGGNRVATDVKSDQEINRMHAMLHHADSRLLLYFNNPSCMQPLANAGLNQLAVATEMIKEILQMEIKNNRLVLDFVNNSTGNDNNMIAPPASNPTATSTKDTITEDDALAPMPPAPPSSPGLK